MAKEVKRTNALGVDMSPETFKQTVNADTHTPTHEHEYEYAYKENREKRKSLLVRPSVEAKITEHAKRTGTSFNAIVCDLLDRYIEENGL